MTRRWLLATLLAIPAAACNELRRYRSSVRFDVSTDSPAAGQSVEVTFLYLDAVEPGTASVVLIRSATGEVVDEGPVADASSRVSLTPPTPGEYGVEFRRGGRMIAHRQITAR